MTKYYSGQGDRWHCAFCGKNLEDYWTWYYEHNQGEPHGAGLPAPSKGDGKLAVLETPGTADKKVATSEPYQFVSRNKISKSVAKRLKKGLCCENPHGEGEDSHE